MVKTKAQGPAWGWVAQGGSIEMLAQGTDVIDPAVDAFKRVLQRLGKGKGGWPWTGGGGGG